MIADILTEKIVIGTVLSYSNNLPEIREQLCDECFTDIKCNEMYSIMCELADAGNPVNIVTVTSAIARKKTHLEPIDILDISDNVCNSDLMPYIERLKELYGRRKLWFIGQRFIKASENELEPLDDIINSARDEISSVYNENKSGISSLKDTTSRLNEIVYRNLNGEKINGTPTGFSIIDEDGGLHESDLIVIAGATSQGKTSFALSMILNASCMGANVAFYSLEMTNVQLSARMVAMKSKIPSKDLLYSRLSQQDLRKFDEGIRNLPLENVFFDDKSTNNINNIIASIRVMKIKHDIKGAVIDYLQILSVTTGRDMNNEQFLGEVARRLKNLAKELDIWIIVLSQLKRDNDNPVPSIDKLRGSGQIAEAADMVILVYRPEVYGRSYPKPFEYKDTHNTAMIDIAKSRNIGTKKFLCTFIPEITMFSDDEVKDMQNKEDMPF